MGKPLTQPQSIWAHYSIIYTAWFFFLHMQLRSVIGQPGNSSIVSRVKLRQTTVQLRKRAGFDDVGHRLGHTAGAQICVRLSPWSMVPFPATECHRHLACTKLYCLVTEAHVCEQLAQDCYVKVERPGVEPMTCCLQVQRPSHHTTEIHSYLQLIWCECLMYSCSWYSRSTLSVWQHMSGP